MTFSKDKILKKIEKSEALSLDEERFYLIEILKFSEENAETVIVIISNKDTEVIID